MTGIQRWLPIYVEAKGYYLLPAVAGTLIAARYLLCRAGRERPMRALLVALAAVAAFSIPVYFNFFNYHFGGFVNPHEFFHYYLGSKYFRELGYLGIYDCTTLADSEIARFDPLASDFRLAPRSIVDAAFPSQIHTLCAASTSLSARGKATVGANNICPILFTEKSFGDGNTRFSCWNELIFFDLSFAGIIWWICRAKFRNPMRPPSMLESSAALASISGQKSPASQKRVSPVKMRKIA